jgi:hypothetical protein
VCHTPSLRGRKDLGEGMKPIGNKDGLRAGVYRALLFIHSGVENLPSQKNEGG